MLVLLYFWFIKTLNILCSDHIFHLIFIMLFKLSYIMLLQPHIPFIASFNYLIGKILNYFLFITLWNTYIYIYKTLYALYIRYTIFKYNKVYLICTKIKMFAQFGWCEFFNLSFTNNICSKALDLCFSWSIGRVSNDITLIVIFRRM